MLFIGLVALRASAYVYPTNIKINDAVTNVTASAGSSIAISYILNQPASAGVTIEIRSDDAVIKSITLTPGSPGTLKGTNTVAWDGTDDSSSPVAAGSYSVSVTAASPGFPVWTQISDDSDGNVLWQGRGIAVDQNTNSPYYGRVFAANSEANDPLGNNWLGFQVGILKCNADSSYADDGGFSTGGYSWAGDTFSPWHLEVGTDDRVYVNDLTDNGQVISWDGAIAPASQQSVLRTDNLPSATVGLSGPALSSNGTNQFLWMADVTATFGSQPGLGILRYPLVDGTCPTGETGVTAVAVGGSLTGNPVDVAVDAAGNIYTIQGNADPGDPSNRVFRFPPYNGSPLTEADWAIGAMDDTMAGAAGIALDPTGTYVAVAFTGLSIGGNGCTQVFYATNGALVTNIDLGITISGFSDHEDHDCAWDAIGNLYYLDNVYGVWRAVSPPGPNQATTTALSTIQIVGAGPAVPPLITGISAAGGIITIDFTAGSNDTSTAFTILAASSVTGTYSPASGVTITSTGPGQFRATLAASSTTQYFRISRQGGSTPPGQPQFGKLSVSNNNVTLQFTADPSASASSFTLLSASALGGGFSPAANAVITQVSPGVFQATVPSTGPSQFYRIKH